jgi:hypothetical protein
MIIVGQLTDWCDVISLIEIIVPYVTMKKKQSIIYSHLVFARQFWFTLMQQFGFSDLSPQPLEMCFFDWWNRAAALVTAPLKKELNSLIILGAWTIW